jgi:hypothetical protein
VKYFVTALTLLLLNSAALALEDTYYSVGVGRMHMEFTGWDEGFETYYRYQPITLMNFSIGRKIDSNLRTQFNIASSLNGEVEQVGSSDTSSLNYKSLALMAIYKGSGASHLRFKVGVMHSIFDHPREIQNKVWVPEEQSTNLVYGIGLGFTTSSNKEFVVELSQLTTDILGLNFNINF